MKRLNGQSLSLGAAILAGQDDVLAELFKNNGTPPLWQRKQSLRTLILIVLEQKVSIVSARAVMQRFDLLCPDCTPDSVLNTPQMALRNIGISERKVSYCFAIAQAMQIGQLNLKQLARKPDDAVVDTLIQIRGIGPWTAGVYVMMSLCRQDAWASGDRALVVSAQESFNLNTIPSYSELDAMADSWRPWRGVAARLLWHAYLLRRGDVTHTT